MAEYIERTERLTLAMNAGARAIENNKQLSGSIYVVDVFSDNPKEISYYEAANLLREVAEAPTAEVEPVRHELRKAVKLLMKNYDRGLNSDYVRNPVAWALYQTWKEMDGGAGNGNATD